MSKKIFLKILMWIGIGAASVALVIWAIYMGIGLVFVNMFSSYFTGVSNGEISAAGLPLIEHNGVIYEKTSTGYNVFEISEKGRDLPIIYIPDEIDGLPVTQIGVQDAIATYHAYLISQKAQSIYLPWSAIDRFVDGNISDNILIVHPNLTGKLGDELYRLSYKILVPSVYSDAGSNKGSKLVYANIAYIFNYEDNPNEGYFFIDLIEETGKLTKPPYDPKREGYTFDGWYKDEGCTEEWSFEEDEVTITFDEEGNRIYEEIKLYAKWKSE